MRDIKFRAWDAIGKRMHNDVVAHKESDFAVNQEKRQWFIMEFAGLKDKNGKEIYEGDILYMKQFVNKKLFSEGRVLVKFEDCEFVAERIKNIGEELEVREEFESLGNYRFDDVEVTIIGNIYENPELYNVVHAEKVPTHKEFQEAVDKSGLRGYKFGDHAVKETGGKE